MRRNGSGQSRIREASDVWGLHGGQLREGGSELADLMKRKENETAQLAATGSMLVDQQMERDGKWKWRLP